MNRTHIQAELADKMGVDVEVIEDGGNDFETLQ